MFHHFHYGFTVANHAWQFCCEIRSRCLSILYSYIIETIISNLLLFVFFLWPILYRTWQYIIASTFNMNTHTRFYFGKSLLVGEMLLSCTNSSKLQLYGLFTGAYINIIHTSFWLKPHFGTSRLCNDFGMQNTLESSQDNPLWHVKSRQYWR